ncbi:MULTISPECIES: hypothetical protein [unclassified Mesorhizobium]|uniref:hypothetical protein n=1 Tax=unclassified Mesorhizobium TaxID=325217 RepID=UPI00333B5A7D
MPASASSLRSRSFKVENIRSEGPRYRRIGWDMFDAEPLERPADLSQPELVQQRRP